MGGSRASGRMGIADAYVDKIFRLAAASIFPLEGEEDRAEHVEGSDPGSDEGDIEEVFLARPGVAEDFVLAPEAGEREESGQAEASDKEGRVSDRHRLAEA